LSSKILGGISDEREMLRRGMRLASPQKSRIGSRNVALLR
jgi:hypothetical protein